MLRKAHIGIFGVLFTLLASCGNLRFAPEEFVRWCANPENGLVKTKELAAMTYRLEFWPTPLLQLQNGQEETAADTYKNMEYFRLHIDNEQYQHVDLVRAVSSGPEQYQELVQQLSFQFEDQITMTVGEKLLPCAHYHFERNYGLRPGLDLVFAFENTDPTYQYNRKVTIDDQVFGSGRLHFSLDRNQLKKAQQSIIL